MKTPLLEVREYGRGRIDGQRPSSASLSMAATKTMASRQARTVVTSGASGPMPHHLLGLVCDSPTLGRVGDRAVSSQRERGVDVLRILCSNDAARLATVNKHLLTKRMQPITECLVLALVVILCTPTVIRRVIEIEQSIRLLVTLRALTEYNVFVECICV